jgi:hypothetical protein
MSAPVGNLASEAALLLDAVAERLESLRSARESAAHAVDDPGNTVDDPGAAGVPVGAEPSSGTDGSTAAPGACPRCGHDPAATPSCTGCPLCRLLAVLRGERPETTARLVDGALSVVQALRSLLPEPVAGVAANGPEPGPGPEGADAPAPGDLGDPGDGGAAGRIERIVVR